MQERFVQETDAIQPCLGGWSAFLFAFGWSLGLAGKLYGVPGVAEE